MRERAEAVLARHRAMLAEIEGEIHRLNAALERSRSGAYDFDTLNALHDHQQSKACIEAVIRVLEEVLGGD